MRIGAHVPVAGGLPRGIEYAVSVGCECVQVFAKSPRRWDAAEIADDVAQEFEGARRAAGIAPVFTHAAYLINIGSTEPAGRERSIAALADELVRGEAIGAEGVVVHMGTRAGDSHHECVAHAAASVADACERASRTCTPPLLLLENSAGAGRQWGATLDELCDTVAAAAEHARVGACLDTCHAHAAGIDVSTPDGWTAIADTIAGALGEDALRLVHANDCSGVFGSHKDRHAWIGDGEIGERGFTAMFRESRLESVSVVIEMPGEPPHKDAENISRLRRLRDGDGVLAG